MAGYIQGKQKAIGILSTLLKSYPYHKRKVKK